MDQALEEKFKRPGSMSLLFLAVLTGPVAWFLDLVTRYALVQVACGKQSTFVLHIPSIVAFVLTVAAGIVGWRLWHEVGARWPSDLEPETEGRVQFMGVLSVMISLLFALAIVAQAIPSFIVSPCVH